MFCIFTYGAVTLYGRPFQTVRLTLKVSVQFQNSRPASSRPRLSTWPTGCPPRVLKWRSCNTGLSFRIVRFRLFRFRSPLLSESRLFSLPPGTEMVHFPGFARIPYFIRICVTGLGPSGFPIRKSADQRLLAPPRSLSQLTASFIACLRQGIHTHALSSLTIKSASNTNFHSMSHSLRFGCPHLSPSGEGGSL